MVLLLAAMLAAAPDLSATLARLDASSARFKSAEANFHKDDYEDLIKDHTLSEGKVYFIRSPSDTEAGIRIDGPNSRIATYKNGMLRDYTPGKANCYTQVDSSRKKAKTESFLTLGFGGSGKELADKWNITDDGQETVNGIKTEKLELVSKDPGVLQNFSKVILWMDLDRDVSIKQQFFAAGTRNTNTAVYSDIQLNKKPNTDPFKYKAGVCK